MATVHDVQRLRPGGGNLVRTTDAGVVRFDRFTRSRLYQRDEGGGPRSRRYRSRCPPREKGLPSALRPTPDPTLAQTSDPAAAGNPPFCSPVIHSGAFMPASIPGGPLTALSNDLAAAVKTVGRSVVAIQRAGIPASGVVWQSGVVVAAHHTIQRDDDITVTLHDGSSAQSHARRARPVHRPGRASPGRRRHRLGGAARLGRDGTAAGRSARAGARAAGRRRSPPASAS